MPELVQTYEQALEFLFDRVNFERTPAGGTQDFKLGRMGRLLELLDNPHTQLPCIHIAGTKGKGSTAIMLAEMLTAAGYRIGLYTSPHVDAFEERMQVAGARPTADQMIELVQRVQPAVRQCESDSQPFSPTFFEITTALAWLFFLQQRAQIVVLEVGLGGRLDSTNVCSPIACVLTTISRDHTQILGNSLSQIAGEKAGIIKPNVPVISGVCGDEALAVIAETCRTQNADCWQLGREFSYDYRAVSEANDLAGSASSTLRVNEAFEQQIENLFHGMVDVTTPSRTWSDMPLTLVGEHQAHNAAVALATIDRLDAAGWVVSPAAARSGLSNVRWPMRIEVVCRRPTVIVDAAHNWESASALGRTLDGMFPSRRPSGEFSRRVLIFAATKDKDVIGILRQLLPRFDSICLTKYLNNPRSVPPEQLVRLIQSISNIPCHMTATPAEAWQLARRIAGPHDLICVTGSFFIAAELRELILRESSASSRLKSRVVSGKALAGVSPRTSPTSEDNF